MKNRKYHVMVDNQYIYIKDDILFLTRHRKSATSLTMRQSKDVMINAKRKFHGQIQLVMA